ncbi:helix-turn-helix domain-containing protein [Cryobacterium sp. PH29-G1]|uniref:helix-turn-helix domain-containing protein n=1 Tax=Cryobacterium sp. PH29-G1 TaxID=3046211 RepID=UPI0024BA6607|nr:helix-turn-helix domain-containing protein [Cryobacterium sp. PH29-G1]MDJ0348172.1 transcriptional regulator [Cryobacterium sp. PH29-G1]
MPTEPSTAVLPAGLRFSSPLEYERMLRTAHERTLTGAPAPEITTDVWDSWQRSLAAGIDPDRHVPRHLHEVADAVALRRGHPLEAVMPALSELLADESSDGQHLLVLADAHGEVLWRVGSRPALRQADGLEFVEGADWSEAGVGTNAISEAVMSGRAAQLFSAEHLVRTHHSWACTAAPIRHPLTGAVLGVLNVSGPLNTVTADSMRMVKCGVRLAEELLRAAHRDLERTVGFLPDGAASPGFSAPGRSSAVALELLGESPAVVTADGNRVPLTLRRAEILALLESRDRGWSADELAYAVHGETGSAASIRIEMHRIRQVLGDALQSAPYRLAPALRGSSDAARVLQLVRLGQVAAALAAYTAPFLARSTAHALEPLRAELTSAVGASVRTSGSVELLRRWCLTEMGSDDRSAVLALGQLAGLTDAAYLAALARLSRIDRELGR